MPEETPALHQLRAEEEIALRPIVTIGCLDCLVPAHWTELVLLAEGRPLAAFFLTSNAMIFAIVLICQ